MADNTEALAVLIQEGLYDKYPDLYIADKPDDKEIEILKRRLKKIGKDHLLTPNSVFVFGRSSMDIPFGSEFNILFSYENLDDCIEVNAILRYANEHPNYESTVVPKGYTGVICLIEFKDKIPEQINLLSVHRQEKWDKSKVVYLSQRPIYDRLKEVTHSENSSDLAL